MKTRISAPAFLLVLGVSLAGLAGSLSAQEASIRASSVVHSDGSRTERQSDLESRTAEEKTIDAKGKMLTRTTYKLDDQGQPTEATHYNAKNVATYRSVYTRDTLGRISEEKSYSLDGQLLQRFVYRFGSNGRLAGIDAFDAQGNPIRGGQAQPQKKKTSPARRR